MYYHWPVFAQRHRVQLKHSTIEATAAPAVILESKHPVYMATTKHILIAAQISASTVMRLFIN